MGHKKPYPNGIPAGTKTRFGWLVDDGGPPDMVAVQMVVSGYRVPDLTHDEAVLAVEAIAEEAKRKDQHVLELVQLRLRITQGRAHALMNGLRNKRAKEKLVRLDG